MKRMRKQLIKLLNIHATSGNEKPVRDYLKSILENYMDNVHVDTYGNLLGDLKCGDGRGATILLSAHMDTVRNVYKDRKLIENNGVISSSKGALGADDRAGIAIILEVLKNLENLSFNGNIKVAFSREEEIGCVGASKIDKNFYKDVDLAIVCDRRGNRDIVVGTFGIPFCCNNVGNFMEDVAKLADMEWKCVEGGISDAMVFAENGINSINLSVGFYNEHTDKEYVVLDDMRDTVKLILQTIAVINDFLPCFQEVPYENKWIKAYKGYAYNKYYYEDSYLDNIWAEESDKNGDVYIYEVGDCVVIEQGGNEVILSRESLKSLLEQLKNV